VKVPKKNISNQFFRYQAGFFVSRTIIEQWSRDRDTGQDPPFETLYLRSEAFQARYKQGLNLGQQKYTFIYRIINVKIRIALISNLSLPNVENKSPVPRVKFDGS